MRRNTNALLLLLLGSLNVAQADVTLPSLFSDHAVLEKSDKVPVWGWAGQNEKVTVTLDTVKAEATAGVDRKWKVELDLRSSTERPFQLQVEGRNKITRTDILVGQVWICSGQSNMAFSLAGATGGPEAARVENPRLRLFTVKQTMSTTPLENCEGTWTVANRAASSTFSAVGYFFGSKLQKELQVPVGLVHTSWGGTPSEAWTSAEALDSDPDLKETRARMMEEIKTYPQRLEAYLTGVPAWETRYQRADRAATALPNEDGWNTVNLPGEIAGPGAVWLRRIVTLPPKLAGKQLIMDLKIVTGLEAVYWNGKKIAETNLAKSVEGAGRSYTIPATEAGDIPLLIRIFNSTGKITLPAAFGMGTSIPSISLSGEWQMKPDFTLPPADKAMLAELPAYPGKNPLTTAKASVLFNGMISPLVPYAMTGVIWYQGESNVTRAFQYRTALPLLINDWRAQWGRGDFPFYYCQIANFSAYKPQTSQITDSDWAELREAQTQTLTLPNTGQAILIDVGEEGDIHPRNKKDVGDRLALLALAKTYGKNVVSSGAVYDSCKIEDDKIRVTFRDTGGLSAKPLPATYSPRTGAPEKPLELYNPNSPLQGFIICGADRKWEWADAQIEGDSVIVTSSKVPQPVAVRYAWANNPICNLSNTAGLPAGPFRTDDFPLSTRTAKYK